MSTELTSVVVFLFIFGGSLLGLFLGNSLPEHHLSQDSKEVVKLGMGVVGTMTALVLGLLVASAKGSFELQKTEVTQMSISVIELDRLLIQYGPGSSSARDLLRDNVELAISRMWPKDGEMERPEPAIGWTRIFTEIEGFHPANDDQRWLRDRALQISMELVRTRWLLFEQGDSAIPTPLLAVVVLWLTVLFVSFGLFAPRNLTVIGTLFIAALSVSVALYMVLDLGRPFHGLIKVASDPLSSALTLLSGQQPNAAQQAR
jgi:hypothetical protein